MTRSPLPAPAETLAVFFKRLDAIEAILRIIVSQARISALFTFRGDPERKVLLDFSKSPARIVLDDQSRDVDVLITIRAEVMHDILSGRMSAGTALAQRELLLRGSASHLARLIPLFDFAPVLYREHLEKIGFGQSSRQLCREVSQEGVMPGKAFDGKPIELVQLSSFEKVLFGTLNGLAFALGYFVGFLRYRLLKKMDLFNVLSAMSRGLAAATPRAGMASDNPGD